jgi:hypothetical protein
MTPPVNQGQVRHARRCCSVPCRDGGSNSRDLGAQFVPRVVEALYIARPMGNRSGETKPGKAAAVGRRDFLRQAAFAGSTAFMVPTIVTVDPADAQALTSQPPQPPGREPPPADLTRPVGVGRPRGAAGSTRQRIPVTDRTELPRTGADIDRLVAAGLAATVGGTPLVLWSAEMRSRSASLRSVDPEPES